MFVGHNTYNNSLLSSNSIRNLKLWINTLSVSCMPDINISSVYFQKLLFYVIHLSACTSFQLNGQAPLDDNLSLPNQPAATRCLGENP